MSPRGPGTMDDVTVEYDGNSRQLTSLYNTKCEIINEAGTT